MLSSPLAPAEGMLITPFPGVHSVPMRYPIGGRLPHPYFAQPMPVQTQPRTRQRGSAMIELAVVGPLITLLGLGALQYGMLFFAKNQINYASFMAARGGAVGHADLGDVQKAYVRALAPLYGGGETPDAVAESAAKATSDMAGNLQIKMLNPTKESFSDWFCLGQYIMESTDNCAERSVYQYYRFR